MAQELTFGIRLAFDGKEVTGGMTVTREQFRQFAAEAKAAGEAAASGFSGAAKGVRSISQQLEEFGKLMGATAKLSLLGVGLSELNQAKQAMLEAQAAADKLKNGLSFAVGGPKAAAEEIDYLRKVTNQLGLEFGSASQAYMKLAASAQGTAMAGKQTRAIFEAVAKASTVMGLSAEEANGALLAIGQMMSKGSVQAEELKGQLGERLPGAFQIAARAMGVTTQELGKMLDNGQVLANDFLPKFAEELTKSLGDAPEKASHSAQAAMNRMTGAWTQAKQAFAETGVTQPLIASLDSIASAMRRFADAVADAKKAGWNGFGQFFAGIGAVEAGAVGAATSVDERKRQLVERISMLRRGREALEGRNLNYLEQESLRDVRRQEAAAREELAALAKIGKIKIDLEKDFNDQLAATQRDMVDIHKKGEDELAKYDDRFAKRKQLADLEKANAALKVANPTLYDQIIGAAKAKLFGADQEAITDARLDVQQAKIKAWYDEYKDIVKHDLEESAVDYQDYWKLVEAGERHLVEVQIGLLEQRKKAAARPGREAEQIRIQGEIAVLKERLATGIPNQTAANQEDTDRKLRAIGNGVKSDWEVADAKTLAAAAAWRRQDLSLLEQELAAAQEKVALDLQARQAQLDKNESLKHAKDILNEFKQAAEDEARATLAGIEAEIRARYEANASWERGANRAIQVYEEQARNVAASTEQAFTRAFSSMEDAAVQFAMTGKFSFSDLARSIIADLIRIQARATMAPITSRLAGLFGISGGTGQSFSEMAVAADINSAGLGGFAKGGVFSGAPSLHDYVNTVRDTPTFFGFDRLHAYASGGVFAEAGPEAVMPLSRDSQGRLGVRAETGASSVSVKVEVTNQSSQPVDARASTPRWDGQQYVVGVVLSDLRNNGPIRQALAMG